MDVVFFEDARGLRPAADYLAALLRAGERSVFASFEHGVDLLLDEGLAVTMPNARMVNRKERLYELRFGDHRIAYIEHEGQIVLLRGWRKRGQKLDRNEERRALRLAQDWRERH